MRAALRAGQALACLLCALSLWAGTARAETLSLSRDQAIAVARQAWFAGDVALTYAIVSEIVAEDPKDVEALFLMSASAGAMGRVDEGLAFGRRAWAAAAAAGRSDALRGEIALTTARLALSAGYERRAYFWMGRVLDLAASPEDRSRIEADRAQLRSRIPLGFSGSFQVSPTDNLNNGATTGLMIIDDQVIPGGSFSGWSVAHAGVRAVASLEAKYSLGVTPDGMARNGLGFGVSTTLHLLTPSEAAANPDLDTTDLDLWRVSARWTHERVLAGQGMEGRPPLRFTLEAAQSWFGGQPYAPSLRAEVDFPLVPAREAGDLTLVAVLERQWQDAPSNAVHGISLHLEGRRALSLPWGQGQLTFGIGTTLLRSDWINSTYDAYDASLTLDPGLDLGPVGAVVGMGMSWRGYEEYALGLVHVTNGRTDQGLWLRAGFSFDDLKVAGMAPTVTLQRQWNWSNISKYQTDTTSVLFGLAAKF